MAPAWFGWLSGLVSGQPVPGTHAAGLEEARLSALLNKELRKPPGQRDEELVHTLRVGYRKIQLENAQARAQKYAHLATSFEHGRTDGCCSANGWVRLRVAASYRALHDYTCQYIQQIVEELAAAEARRPAVIVIQPALHLDLPEPLQQQPPRLDMCSKCAEWMLQMELLEQSYSLEVEHLQQVYQSRGMQAAPGASLGGAGAAAAAGDVGLGEAQHAQQQQQQCDSSSGDAPLTPRQPPPPPLPPQQHTSLELEQQM